MQGPHTLSKTQVAELQLYFNVLLLQQRQPRDGLRGSESSAFPNILPQDSVGVLVGIGESA